MRKRKKSIWRYRQNLRIISKLIVIKHDDEIFTLLFHRSEHKWHFSSYTAPTNFPSLIFLVIMLSFLLLFLVLEQCTICKVKDLSFSAISYSFFNSLSQVPRKLCYFQSALSLYWRPLSSEEMTQSGFWPLPLFFFFLFIFISWRLITLQYRSGSCHTLTWISHGFTCIPHPDPPSHLPLYPIPLGLPSAPGLSTCLVHPTWAGDLFHYR